MGYASFAAIIVLACLLLSKENEVLHHGRVTRLLAALGLASTGSEALAGMAVPTTRVGLNLSVPVAYWPQRSFANLAIAGIWQTSLPGSPPVPTEYLDANGYLKSLPDGQPVFRLLNWPSAPTKEANIRCSFGGQATVKIAGQGVSAVRHYSSGVTFRWTNTPQPAGTQILFRVMAMDAANPIRDLDCREETMPRSQRFDPQFLALVRQFKVLRFMDWQRTNDNAQIDWAGRHTKSSIDIHRGDGVAMEDMVDLVNQTGADPWFNMPWNTDDTFIRNFAQYVHDNIPSSRHVYVETGNEVWNARFPMSKQALSEGQSRGLASDREVARLFRYAERHIEVMRIWSSVFADRPSQLVRVANCQNGPNRPNLVLGYKNVATYVDAVATAPYFGYDFRAVPPANVDEAFRRIDDAIDKAIEAAFQAKTTAFKFHKRFIAYEAGQHIVLNDLELANSIQRDPRMYAAYGKYLDRWQHEIGDVIVMFTSVQPNVRTGSWGLLEYAGQSVAEAPKMRAVMDALKASGH